MDAATSAMDAAASWRDFYGRPVSLVSSHHFISRTVCQKENSVKLGNERPSSDVRKKDQASIKKQYKKKINEPNMEAVCRPPTDGVATPAPTPTLGVRK